MTAGCTRVYKDENNVQGITISGILHESPINHGQLLKRISRSYAYTILPVVLYGA